MNLIFDLLVGTVIYFLGFVIGMTAGPSLSVRDEHDRPI